MVRKIAFGLLWLGAIVYAFFLSPPQQPGTFELIKNLSLAQWQGINPLIIALFNLMGVWPVIYSAVVFIDGRGQKVPAWLFAMPSFAVGAFAILPYLALREPNQKFIGKKNTFVKLLDSRVTGFVLTVAAVILVAYGLTGADWTDFIQQWQTNRFIHVMSLDFCLLCLLFPTLVRDDMARRGWENPQIPWLTALIPLFGPLIYLCVRPSLPEVGAETVPTKQPTLN
ncbi:MAG: DUF2834 domain-containing protein [Nostoc sp. ChiSLP01]|nr:DUF2834 domain-containing protein [Nostoc sp. CmiSLP01]MDZ8285709.1 DUF2834 domain-containing protein [Nostoc sp. ChiSLP01]